MASHKLTLWLLLVVSLQPWGCIEDPAQITTNFGVSPDAGVQDTGFKDVGSLDTANLDVAEVDVATDPDIADAHTPDVCAPQSCASAALVCGTLADDGCGQPLVCGQPTCVRDVSLGIRHSCALLRDGAVYCWGDNLHFQLGNTNAEPQPLPTRVANLWAEDIDVGHYHSCALTTQGALQCWGHNSRGQIGLPPENPVQQAEGNEILASAEQIFAGFEDHSCALADSKLYCWGQGSLYRLGNNSTADNHVPTHILDDVLSVASGQHHGCALVSSGQIWCWGSAEYFQNGDALGQPTPALVASLSDDNLHIGAGQDHSCVVKPAGRLWCWGRNNAGQLGPNADVARSAAPIEVTGFEPATVIQQVDAGVAHTCALGSHGKVWCWGRNNLFQLGDGTLEDSPVPKLVEDLPHPAVSLASGWNHNCVIDTQAELRCWGHNAYGQLGDGLLVNRELAFKVEFPDP
ncbi:MAG: hypothetical protein H0U74_01820 [Bradymonadaceae bacterium]|nr:hypothetical protein [Lujinxingiaceae bacterium]